MKYLLFFLIFIISTHMSAQKKELVSTTGVIDTNSTKSGYQINDYFIELSDKQRDSLKGKKVKVSGELLIVDAIDPNDTIIKQGSLSERKFIINPSFKIIYDKRKTKKD